MAGDAVTLITWWEWLSWVAQVIETGIVVPLAGVAIWQLILQRQATQDQVRATFNQTFATIVSWVQAEEIRESRRLLFEFEDTLRTRQVDHWEREWVQAADRVSQAFNSVAIIALRDPQLNEGWIQPTRHVIVRIWKIVEPRILARRMQENDAGLWLEFEQLAGMASKF
jgi:hypothetical protein